MITYHTKQQYWWGYQSTEQTSFISFSFFFFTESSRSFFSMASHSSLIRRYSSETIYTIV